MNGTPISTSTLAEAGETKAQAVAMTMAVAVPKSSLFMFMSFPAKIR